MFDHTLQPLAEAAAVLVGVVAPVAAFAVAAVPRQFFHNMAGVALGAAYVHTFLDGFRLLEVLRGVVAAYRKWAVVEARAGRVVGSAVAPWEEGLKAPRREVGELVRRLRQAFAE